MLFIFAVCASSLYAQKTDINFAFNLGNIGLGMNLSPEIKEGHITYTLLNLYVEHKKTNIGIEFSPFNCWMNYSHTEFLMDFINLRLFYNLINQWEKSTDDNNEEETAKGSDYALIGPFVSINYLGIGNRYSANPDNIQCNAGLKALLMIDYSHSKEGSFPIGFQCLNIELGYRFNNSGSVNHYFYFNLTADIAIIPLIAYLTPYNASETEKRNRL
jgi:hypothetical protein